MKSDEDPKKYISTEDRGMIGYLTGLINEKLDCHCWEEVFSIGFVDDHQKAVKDGLRRCFQNDFDVVVEDCPPVDHDASWRLILSSKTKT